MTAEIPVPAVIGASWGASYKTTAKSEAVRLDLRALSLTAIAEAFADWRVNNGADYYSVTFEQGGGVSCVVPLHQHFSPPRLEEVVAKMRTMGPPRIRAYYDAASSAWFTLEGTHRLRAAVILGLTPVMVPARWPRSRRALERARHAIAHRGHLFTAVTVAGTGNTT